MAYTDTGRIRRMAYADIGRIGVWYWSYTSYWSYKSRESASARKLTTFTNPEVRPVCTCG